VKVLVYPHDLGIGGSQINAIDLAAEVAAHGHEAIVYALDGPLSGYIAERGLRWIRANPLHYRPGPTRIPQIHRIVKEEGIDLIHGYEWPPTLDAFYGAHLPLGTPLVCTVLSMSVSPLVPRTLPLIMGTAQLGDDVRKAGFPDVKVLEPPIDTTLDTPDTDGRPWRDRLGITDDEIVVASVSRFSLDLKLDALVDAIDAAAILAPRHPIRLVLVGDGEAFGQLRARADQVNRDAGREVVLLPGSTLEPRPAYAGADIVVGMGSSALRAMAHGRPLVVQGERGWALPCTEETMPTFLWQGFWGVGDGTPAGPELAAHLEPLLADPVRRRDLGTWSRGVVLDRFSLTSAATWLAELYEDVATVPRPPLADRAREAFRCGRRAAALEFQYHRPSWKRREQQDSSARLAAAGHRQGASS
jgi:L-malate glycosyltransferase